MKIRKIFSTITSSLLVFIPLLTTFLYTAPTPVYAATSPSLGQADSFAILAGTPNITNTGTSAITGNVGLDPATGAGIGLTCAEVTGTIYDNDGAYTGGGGGSTACRITNAALLTQAKADLVSAYDALSSGDNATCTVTYAGTQDLVGLSLVPGVYCADAFALSGTLTLSGSGVWVFRSASTLVTSGTANVIGGDACSVWWKVVSSATLGTNTDLTGNILALTDITMATGADLSGRALARNGAVTLDSNTINKSSCSTVPVTNNPPAPTAAPLAPIDSTSAPNPPCPPIIEGVVAPAIIDSNRVDADSIFVSWGPYSGTDQFNVRYGPSDGNWLYNTDVTGFSTTLNGLPSNTPLWVQVAARNECQIGEYGPASLIGRIAPVSYPDTFVPRLPNTGLAPEDNYSNWYILAGVLLGSSALLISIRRKV